MAIRLGSNISSIVSQRRLGEATNTLSKVYERLSSGQRINRASDDAAGLAIADSLNAKSKIYTQAIRNGNDGISYLNIADSALSELSGIVVRIRELSEQSANGTYSNQQRSALDAEAQALSKEFTRITQTTSFNSVKIFAGDGGNILLQLGDGANSTLNASIGGAIGTGAFESAAIYSSEPTNSRAVALVDLNSDGILDMVSAGNSASAGAITVRLGLGDGSFGTETLYSVSGTISTPNSFTVADLNGDNIKDLAIIAGYRAYTMFGAGDGSFGSAVMYTMNANLSASVAVGDLNGDGIVDLISGGRNGGSTGSVAVRLGTGNGAFGNVTIFSSEHSSLTNTVTLGDLNNDGILDLVTGGTGGNAIARLGNGNGTFGSASVYSMGGISVQSMLLTDLDNDGILDMVSANPNGTVRASVRLGNGNGTFGDLIIYSSEMTNNRNVVAGDMNGDGIVDLVFAGYSGSVSQVSVLLGAGNGTFGAAIVSSTGGSRNWSLAIGDLNGDGVLDVATAGDTTGGGVMVMMADTKEGLGALLHFSLRDRQSARDSMNMLDRTLQNLAKQRGTIGASLSRVDTAISNLQSARENFKAAESRIRDTDIASDAAELVRTQILQQAASSVLAQANQAPALALKLLT